ncbi:MAG: bifunctional UDP-N-acetylglucosamine diphosphorylase/glucosamine-1-phosphate N-acetyltransferase GlmU [Oscillospiraceae bacterium]|jgi:bifunctional UDP-N-acetylglucosamine pyrophosphorylase/glucosamine-1-phosphate N-acetyltransferase|nr:bifunctional UDP-N-acetylglucosamine diphosphorylase/glucosamine-1-phosphate N-acetyltransferase GlmU [Oscillospiraceae bacterium]
MTDNTCCVILAAGEGTRMKANKPKVMLEVQLKPMIGWVIDAVKAAGVETMCVVTGHLADKVEAYIPMEIEAARQNERLGTGHAVMCASEFLERNRGKQVLICCGDAPFIDSNTIKQAYEQHIAKGDAVTVISAVIDNPTGYGRMIRNSSGSLLSIVEQKEATEEQKAVREVNSGAYWFDVSKLLSVLAESKLKASGLTGEYYLTDAVELLISSGYGAGAFTAASEDIVIGANTPLQLHELNKLARDKILARHIENGVNMPCTDGIIIGPDVTIGANTTVLPGTMLYGETKIGNDCVIGPNSSAVNCNIGDRVVLNASQARQCVIDDGADIGPFSQIRPNSTIGNDVHIGDFVEVKNSVIGNGTKISHLTYVGDSDVGAGVNFGCGCVTVNYDGVGKARCVIEDDAFIGCNTNLVAPVRVGKGAYTAAGSTIVEDVPENSLGIARQRQIIKPDWALNRFREKK